MVATIGALPLSGAVGAGITEPFGFKNLLLGSSLQAIRVDPRFAGCKNMSVDDPGGCWMGSSAANETIAGYGISLLALHFYHDRLYKIVLYFHPSGFDSLANALREKYGKPAARSRDVLQNPFGALFPTKMLVWRRPTSTIHLMQYAQSLSSGAVVYSLAGVEKLEAAMETARTKKSAKDL